MENSVGRARVLDPSIIRDEVRSGLSLEDLEACYRHSGEAVLHRCRQLLRNEEKAWDAMHATFVKAIRHRDTFRGERGALGWLLSIAFGVCMDELRAGRARDAEGPDVSESCLEVEDRGALSFRDRLSQRELVAWLLPRFDQETQQIAVLRFFDELEVAEIARQTSLSERTVARRLSRFVARSRLLLQETRA